VLLALAANHVVAEFDVSNGCNFAGVIPGRNCIMEVDAAEMKSTLASIVIGLSYLIATSSAAYAADYSKDVQLTHQVSYSAVLKEERSQAGKAKEPWRCVVVGRNGRVPDKHPSYRWYMPIPAESSELHWSWEGWMREIGWFPYAQNYKKAVKLYRSAAERGHALAQTSLGMMYATGKGVPKDLREAYKWFNLAMLNYKKEAAKGSGNGSKPMTTAEISRVKTLARRCIAKNFEGC